jgi:hypothetical protein
MTYQNAQESTRALFEFGARPYIEAIEQTLSGDNVIPRGRYVRLSLERYFRSPLRDQMEQQPITSEVPA